MLSLRPCPFCRSRLVDAHALPSTGNHYVQCATCEASGPSAPSESAAAARWNAYRNGGPSERQQKAADLRGQGLTVPEIAGRLRLSQRTVYRDLAALPVTTEPDA